MGIANKYEKVGMNVKIRQRKLQPGNIDAHYVYYNNFVPSSGEISNQKINLGQVMILHANKTKEFEGELIINNNYNIFE
jgi:pyruvate/2-oxoglutarate dehydrogenase complex dihydrolipoamide acyltransferase (E2) component